MVQPSTWRGRADFIFTCPLYGDLERYPDDPADLFNMHYDVFLGSFRAVIKQADRQLQDNRFAAFVVGDFRDKNGIYRGFVNDTVNACKDAGLLFYDDAVLVTAGGFLPMRTRGSFEASRKLGKACIFPDDITQHSCDYAYHRECRFPVSFSADRFYEAKAWEVLSREQGRRGGDVVFWNVAGRFDFEASLTAI